MTTPAPPEPTTTAPVAAGVVAVGAATAGAAAVDAAAQLVAVYGQQVARLRAGVLAAVVRFWRSLGSWRDQDADRFVEAMVPFIAAGQQQTAMLTAAYLEQLATVRNTRNIDRTTPRLTLPAVDTRSLRGVDATEVYRRPFATTWTELSRDKPLTEAVNAGERRAVDIAGTDLQLAKTHTTQAVLAEDPMVIGYRRVLKGETSCAKCVLASTLRYRVDDLMPIHPGCDCDQEPIYGEEDPGKVLSGATVEQLHEIVRRDLGEKYVNAGGRGEVAYSDIIVTHQHGELGPVLAVRGQKFTGPSSIPS